jgi:hypothetical protein
MGEKVAPLSQKINTFSKLFFLFILLKFFGETYKEPAKVTDLLWLILLSNLEETLLIIILNKHAQKG